MNAGREFADIIEKYRVFILTGAGVSAESGIPTFRDECDPMPNGRRKVCCSSTDPLRRSFWGACRSQESGARSIPTSLSRCRAIPHRVALGKLAPKLPGGRGDPEGEVATGETHVLHHPRVISFDIKTVVNGGR